MNSYLKAEASVILAYIVFFIVIFLCIFGYEVLSNSNSDNSVKKETSISCIGEMNYHDNSNKDFLRYLQEWKDMSTCNVKIAGELFNIPYWRLVKYETLWNEKIKKYFEEELGPIEENELFNNLFSQAEAQYLMVDLAYKFWFYGVQWCDLSNWSWLCQASFNWSVWIWMYKYDTFNESLQWGSTSIYCDLNQQVRNYPGESKEEFLRKGVKNCRIVHTESGWEYEVGHEFKTLEEKEKTLKYITKKVNNEIEFINWRGSVKTIVGKVEKIIVNDNPNYLDNNNTVNTIQEGDMSKKYFLELKDTTNSEENEYISFNVDGSYGTIKKGDNIEVSYVNWWT